MPSSHTTPPAYDIAIGDLVVRRMGLGAMRLAGVDGWGPPTNRESALELLRCAVRVGVGLIDTADSYGPESSENLIAEALHPYPGELVIATKGGIIRSGPAVWRYDGRPEHLRSACEESLTRLRLESIDLYQFHAPDPKVPFEESIGALSELREEGKIRNIGVCNVGRGDLARALEIVDVVSVQNRFSLADRSSARVLDVCEEEGLAFLPWLPLALSSQARAVAAAIAEKRGATVSQVALAWLISYPKVLPIPGTSSMTHLEENIGALELNLSDAEIGDLGAVD